ncbi:unnamed protein product [Protopolystoma xenopodis]|uniref:Uncharacterized protein n=1 Tax=Protopolystoma xenopodis TaxID=117903 RepID=A0A3S5AVJ3_9PLAT|nr:unnamed protein product [Protopolystoma xenopodis]
MVRPTRLPCGAYVDYATLQKFWSARSGNRPDADIHRFAVDPFTMLTLDPTSLKIDEGLARRSKRYLERKKELVQFCRRLDLCCPGVPMKLPLELQRTSVETNLQSDYDTEENEEEAMLKIMSRFPHINGKISRDKSRPQI